MEHKQNGDENEEILCLSFEQTTESFLTFFNIVLSLAQETGRKIQDLFSGILSMGRCKLKEFSALLLPLHVLSGTEY